MIVLVLIVAEMAVNGILMELQERTKAHASHKCISTVYKNFCRINYTLLSSGLPFHHGQRIERMAQKLSPSQSHEVIVKAEIGKCGLDGLHIGAA